ncbi:LANO_0E10638g1_1 [Lachancea nothofagi CBS 11611]|uniref:Coatomer subunit beta n=1 Tax=Lachancea nothofagi CBS 11611 TaxID=1266666 RepID=A0A1G4JWQ7_9SACH|nr:LANO_0E10638g1_1 [Lachancea nothofagi CBS 11611]
MSATLQQSAYTLVYDPSPNLVGYTNAELQKSLEKGSDEEKVHTMKRMLVMMLDGNPLSDMLMHVIRFVMPSKNKQLKKLLYFYWEIVPKLDAEGKLKQEMILVCNAIQHDLQHPNEYIRGNTLRFLTKLREADLLEQMVPAVRSCLEYRHAYIRKYAILAVYSIYKVSDHLIPDACEIINSFLVAETDPICKRNAFLGLAELDRESALNYLQENIATIESLDSLLQDAFIDFIRKDAIQTPSLKPQYVDLLQDLLNATTSHEVVFEASLALTVLTSDPKELCQVASKLIDVAVKESDNNIKLIVLERIQDIHKRAPGFLEELTLDILRVLSAQDLDVRAKALNIGLELVSSRNVDDVIKLLKKELQITITNAQNDEKAVDYRQILIENIHKVAIRFVEVSADVVSLFLEFIGDLSSNAASGVIAFIKEVIEKYPQLRKEILQHLLGALPYVSSAKAYRGALWILGEYSLDAADVQSSWKHIRSSIGELPIVQSEVKQLEGGDTSEEPAATEEAPSSGPVVLPDGTYATESAFSTEHNKTSTKEEKESRPPLRRFILKGDFYTTSVLATTIVKCVLRFEKTSADSTVLNALKAEAMLILVSVLRAGQSTLVEKKIDEDSSERIMIALSVLMSDSDTSGSDSKRLLEMAYLEATKNSFETKVASAERESAKKSASVLARTADPIDKAILFRQFAAKDIHNTPVDTINEDLEMAISGDSVNSRSSSSIMSKLRKVVPLTGFSDPIYGEAYITNHQFDVVLEVLLVNQTKETLRNLHVQFATLGDLKIIDNPPSTNVVAHGFHKLTVTVKVSSADTGVIFGNIIYDGGHGEDARYVIMNDIHVDIMDYIKPAKTDDATFRKMWNAFEWENKITVKSKLPTLHAYLEELVKGTRMGILTSEEALGERDCRFLSCNLYSKSTFGEDALANLCIEKDPVSGEVVGHVRIRSKGQGLALSLGDRVALIAREMNKLKLDRM